MQVKVNHGISLFLCPWGWAGLTADRLIQLQALPGFVVADHLIVPFREILRDGHQDRRRLDEFDFQVVDIVLKCRLVDLPDLFPEDREPLVYTVTLQSPFGILATSFSLDQRKLFFDFGNVHDFLQFIRSSL